MILSIPDTMLRVNSERISPLIIVVGFSVSLSTTLRLNNFLPSVCPLFVYWNTTK